MLLWQAPLNKFSGVFPVFLEKDEDITKVIKVY